MSRSGGPLAGVRVVVTRAAEQAAGLTAALEAAGSRVELLPLIEVVPPANPGPLERAAAAISTFDWVVFSSANGVAALFAELERTNQLASPANPSPFPRLAAVGRATADALAAHGFEPHVVAARSDARGLAEALADQVRGRRVLLPQAADARPTLAEGLSAAGADLTTLVAYDKRTPESAALRAGELFEREAIGWVTFSSGGIARRFIALLGDRWQSRRQELKAASIGPVTSADLRALGVEPAAEAAEPSASRLVEAIEQALRAGPTT